MQNERQIKNRDEAIELANKIAKYAINDNFKPFLFISDFEETRTTAQNKYYWAGVVTVQYDHFKGDLMPFSVGYLKRYLVVKLANCSAGSACVIFCAIIGI